MRSYTKTEITVGAFVLLGAAALGYLSISIGGLRIMSRPTLHVSARFASVGPLKVGAPVEIAGVPVGQVTAIGLSDYLAEVHLSVHRDVPLPADTIASIRTAGLLGDAYVSLSPGGSDKDLHDGGRIRQTEPSIDLLEIISKYAFGGGSSAAPKHDGAGTGASSPFGNPLEGP